MKKSEANQILADAIGSSVRTLENWRSRRNGSPSNRIALAALESLERDGTPVRMGDLEILVRRASGEAR